MSVWSAHRLRRSEPRPAGSHRAATNAPKGKPMKRRSKKSDGMMKKLSSLKIDSVNSAVANDRPNRPAVSAATEPQRAGVSSSSRSCGGRAIGTVPRDTDEGPSQHRGTEGSCVGSSNESTSFSRRLVRCKGGPLSVGEPLADASRQKTMAADRMDRG